MLHKKRTNFSKRVMGNKKNVPTEVNTLTVTVYYILRLICLSFWRLIILSHRHVLISYSTDSCEFNSLRFLWHKKKRERAVAFRVQSSNNAYLNHFRKQILHPDSVHCPLFMMGSLSLFMELMLSWTDLGRANHLDLLDSDKGER